MSNTKPDFNSEKNIAKIKAILTKPADQRTSHEIKRLLQPLMADISFSKERKLKPHELNEICLGLEYDHVPKHSYVIHDGDEDGGCRNHSPRSRSRRTSSSSSRS